MYYLPFLMKRIMELFDVKPQVYFLSVDSIKSAFTSAFINVMIINKKSYRKR